MNRELSEQPLEQWYRKGPYILAAVGVALSASANVFHLFDDWAILARVVFLVAGILLAAAAVAWRLRTLDDNPLERSRAASLVAFANLAVLGSFFALHQEWGSLRGGQSAEEVANRDAQAFATIALQNQPLTALAASSYFLTGPDGAEPLAQGKPTQEWDSMRMVVLVLWWVGVGGAIVVFLPAFARKIVVSMAIVFHFGGITTAVTAVNIGQISAPWLPIQAWNKVYRHYLHFTYLINAYHFYSPEPGPPTLIWFLVEFEDKSTREVKLIRREDCSTRLKYQRFLAVTESINSFSSQPTEVSADLPGLLVGHYFDFWHEGLHIAPRNRLAIEPTYHEPSAPSLRYLQSYVRFVARTTKNTDNPSLKVRSVRVYKLWHRIVTPYELKSGLKPLDETNYLAWYMGNYTPDGEQAPYPGVLRYTGVLRDPEESNLLSLLRSLFMMQETVREPRLVLKSLPNPDPFRYFSLPIYRPPLRNNPDIGNIKHWGKLVDTLDRHMYPEKYKNDDLNK